MVVGFLASSAVSAPVMLTGNPDPSDYDIVVTDAAGEEGLAEHLDIDQLLLAADDETGPDARFYLGLTVNDPDISRTGGPTSFVYRTVLDCFFVGEAGDLLHELAVVLTADDVVAGVDGVMLDAARFSAAVDSGLEVSIDQDAMPNLIGVDTFDVLVQLDDTGTNADDQLAAFGVPEPATFGLLLLGGVVGLTRRRR
ncbi:MAG: PEP-CTERM sorting domain-containing protein [Planctomycetota bacterium]